MIGSFVADDSAVADPAGARSVDLTASTMELTPASSTLANQYNSISFCAYTDWTVGVAKSMLFATAQGLRAPAPIPYIKFLKSQAAF